MLMENALVTKIRAIYGKMLNDNDFMQLIKKKSVFDIASYLKNHPFYQEAFKTTLDQNINRKRLEEIIRKYHFLQTLKLIKFVASKNKKFYEINIIEKEHQIIMSMLKSYISDDKYDVVENLPIFFDKYSKMNLLEISKTKNIMELVAALKETNYAKILKPYVGVKNDIINFMQFEMLFEKNFDEYVSKKIEEFFKGNLKNTLLNILSTKSELSNVVKIYRLKKFYNTPNDEIKKILINKYDRMSEKKIDNLLNFQTPDDLLKKILRNKADDFENRNNDYIENYINNISYQVAKKTLLYSQKAPLVYLSFLTISSVEINNLIHIIEGIRYGVSENEIKDIIII